MTPEQERISQQRKLDARCLDCGAGMAATSRCYRCGSTRLHLIAHGADEWTHCLAGRGAPAEKVHRDTSAARLARRAASKAPEEAIPAAVGTLGL